MYRILISLFITGGLVAASFGSASDEGGTPVGKPQEATTTVVGVIQTGAGEPVSMTSVWIKDTSVGATSMSDGSYHIKGAPADTQTIICSSREQGRSTRTVVLDSTRTDTVDFVLRD